MAIVQKTVLGAGGDKNIELLVNISGADEANTIVYDNSAFVNNPAKGNVMAVTASGSDCLVTLKWDQTIDSPVIALNPVNSPKFNFQTMGGIRNPNEAGATGDLLVTTTGVGATGAVTLIIWITQN